MSQVDSLGARTNSPSASVPPPANLTGRRAQVGTEPLADHGLHLAWSSRGRVLHMSAEQAAMIRQTHLNGRDPQGEQLESASRIAGHHCGQPGGIDHGAWAASQAVSWPGPTRSPTDGSTQLRALVRYGACLPQQPSRGRQWRRLPVPLGPDRDGKRPWDRQLRIIERDRERPRTSRVPDRSDRKRPQGR